MSDKRESERFNLAEFQQVFDAETEKVVGYLGDISQVGLKLLSKQPFPIGQAYRLRVNYILLGGEPETVELDTESVWAAEPTTMPYRETGFQIHRPSAATSASIAKIVDDLRQRKDD